MNTQLVDKLIDKLEGSEDPALNTILERAKSLKEGITTLSEDLEAEIEVLSDDEKMQRLIKLDDTMNFMYDLGTHLSKRMLENPDNDMRDLYTKSHNLCMKMAEMFSEKRKSLTESSFIPMSSYSQKLLSELPALTGEKDQDKQLDKLMAYKEAMDKVTLLSEEVTKKTEEVQNLRSIIQLADKTKLVDEAIHGKNKKLTPAQRTWALSCSKEQIEAFLESAPLLMKDGKVVEKEIEQSSLVKLTEEEIASGQVFGISEKDLLAAKLKRLAK